MAASVDMLNLLKGVPTSSDTSSINAINKFRSLPNPPLKSLLQTDARFGELGEISNPQGGISTEYSITEHIPELGGWVNIPSLVQGQVDVEGLLSGNKITPQKI